MQALKCFRGMKQEMFTADAVQCWSFRSSKNRRFSVLSLRALTLLLVLWFCRLSHSDASLITVVKDLSKHGTKQLADTKTFYNSNAPTSIYWQGIASDSTGQYLAAAGSGGVYTTKDFGTVWLKSSAPSTLSWSDVACDSTGQYLAATSSSGIYTSFDYGASWVQSSAPNASAVSWSGIASDSTGQYLAASSFSGGIYTSSDYGVNWVGTATTNLGTWFGITSDSTGRNLSAVGQQAGIGVIITSSNNGSTWIDAKAPQKTCRSITSDSTGRYIAATAYCGNIYISSDYGSTWQTTAPYGCWWGIASDSTGMYLVAVANYNNGFIYTSSDYGLSWTKANAPVENWLGVASDSTGQYIAATSGAGGIYTTEQPASSQPTSQPSVSPTGQPFLHPSSRPTSQPQALPSSQPSSQPSMLPTMQPQALPSSQPTSQPTMLPTLQPQAWPSAQPSSQPSASPTLQPQAWPTAKPSTQPTTLPTAQPTAQPSAQPSAQPTGQPSSQPSAHPSAQPSVQPTMQPTAQPSRRPSCQPFSLPSAQPTAFPSSLPGTFESTVSITAMTPTYNTSIGNLGHYSATYVTVQLLLSYLSASSGGFVTVTAGSGSGAVEVEAACAPITACSMQPTYCAVNVDISRAITSGKGGSVELRAVVNTQHLSGAAPVLCNYGGKFGIYYKLNYTVSAFLQPTHQPTRIPTFGPTKFAGTVVINTGSHLVTAGGAPFYVIGFVAAAFTILGVVLVRLHDDNQKTTPLKLVTTCLTFALLGNTMVSELFYIIVLLQANDGVLQSCAIGLIMLRLVNAAVAVFVLYRIFAPLSHLYALLDNNQLLKQARIYSMLQIVMMFDVSIVRYFPWLVSEMTIQAMGYPESQTFRLSLYTKMLLSGISLVIQAVVLLKVNESRIDNSYTVGLIVLNMVVTVLVFVSGAVTAMLQMHAIKRDPGIAAQRDRDSTISVGNPMVEMTAMNNLESGGAGTIGVPTTTAESTVETLSRQAALIEELSGRLANQEHELRALRAFVEDRLGSMVASEVSSL